jgi:VIT1/CCC1 family predicted Fe2+/Mn2+ transporter
MHTDEAIATRLASAREQSYLGDAVLGAMDGTVTTFATVAAVAGAGLGPGASAAMGLASLIADGFSMAVGNYFRAKADAEVVEQVRRMEEEHVDKVPEGEREEVRQIFRQKGFEGDILERIVETITQDRERWIDTMVTEEWGLKLETQSPLKAAASTYAAFVCAGAVPLVPLFFLLHSRNAHAFVWSSIATVAVFFGIGYWKGVVLASPRVRGGFETLGLGTGAAAIAYGIGRVTQSWIGG